MSRVPVSTKPLGVPWPVANTSAYGPTSTSVVGADHTLEGRLPYRRTRSGPFFPAKPRVIIPHSGFSFAAPPQAR